MAEGGGVEGEGLGGDSGGGRGMGQVQGGPREVLWCGGRGMGQVQGGPRVWGHIPHPRQA